MLGFHDERVDWSKKHLAVPIKYQVPLLGITDVASLKSKRVVDVGCGDGSLVDFLREQGVEAYGVDSIAPEKPHFFRKLVVGAGRENGIPLEDNSVDLIVSFQNWSLDSAFSIKRRMQEYEDHPMSAKLRVYATYILYELDRTLRVGGEARIFPSLTLLSERAGFILKTGNLVDGREPIQEIEVNLDYLDWESRQTGVITSRSDNMDFLNGVPEYSNRTVLRKIG